ncbi:MAG: hypothetical protein ACKN9W_13880 [Methylococcus sp.]
MSIKLTGCGLLDAACQELGIAECWLLSSLKPQLKKSRGKLAQYFSTWPADAQRQIVSFAEQAQPLPPAENQEFIERYLNEHGLDLGELQLLEAVLRVDNSLLLTGDKRFLKQLAGTPDLLDMALEKLPGRLVCLESVLLLLMDRYGFAFVRNKVLPCKEYDGLIKVAFGIGESRTEAHAREALIYELHHLGEDVARLLHSAE